MMCLLHDHTGSLYQRQEANLVLFILRGAKHLLNLSYRRSTPRTRALPADPQVCKQKHLQQGQDTMDRDLIPTTPCPQSCEVGKAALRRHRRKICKALEDTQIISMIKGKVMTFCCYNLMQKFLLRICVL